MIVLLLMVHALVAVALLGAITHQCLASWHASFDGARGRFLKRFRTVAGSVYSTPIAVLYLVNLSLGCVLYADYRLEVRPALELTNQLLVLALFETKEHLAVYGLGLLPGYWTLWNREATSRTLKARRIVTTLLMFFVWWCFLVGLFVNNISGMPT